MPTITVRTKPVKGKVTIWRVNPNGMMTFGQSPQRAHRVYPWPYAVGLQPVVLNGNLWMPEIQQERGFLERDETKTYRYIKMGKYPW